jgi:hypothetical protein
MTLGHHSRLDTRYTSSHGLGPAGGFLGCEDLLSPTTFYPCGLSRPSPDSLCVFRRERKTLRRRPHLCDGLLGRPGSFPGRLHQHQGRAGTSCQQTFYPFLSPAPSGNAPVSRKRHRAMSNLRATATIPIRLKRLPPPPKRSRNHTLKALSG